MGHYFFGTLYIDLQFYCVFTSLIKRPAVKSQLTAPGKLAWQKAGNQTSIRKMSVA